MDAHTFFVYFSRWRLQIDGKPAAPARLRPVKKTV